MPDARLPWSQSHVSKGPPAAVAARVEKHPLRLGAAATLLDLCAEYVFFTPAVPYLYGLFSDVMLADYMAEARRDVRFYHHGFRREIFSGLEVGEDRDWNRVLWALGLEDWPSFLDFVSSLTLSLRDEGIVLRYRWQAFAVADPLVEVLMPDALVPITAFGIDGNNWQLAFGDTGDAFRTPTLRRYDPDRAMEAFARAHLEGRNPIDAEAASREGGQG